jgi:hypothetical protein
MAFPSFIGIVERFAKKHQNESTELDFLVTFNLFRLMREVKSNKR